MSLFTYLSESQSEERVYEVAYNIHNALSQYEFQLLPGLLMDILLGKVCAFLAVISLLCVEIISS